MNAKPVCNFFNALIFVPRIVPDFELISITFSFQTHIFDSLLNLGFPLEYCGFCCDYTIAKYMFWKVNGKAKHKDILQ